MEQFDERGREDQLIAGHIFDMASIRETKRETKRQREISIFILYRESYHFSLGIIRQAYHYIALFHRNWNGKQLQNEEEIIY